MWTTSYQFDDLPLLVAPGEQGGLGRIGVPASGEALIDFERDGTWCISGLKIEAAVDSRRFAADAEPIALKALSPGGGPSIWWTIVENALLVRRNEEIEQRVREALADPDLDVEDHDRASVIPFPLRPRMARDLANEVA